MSDHVLDAVHELLPVLRERAQDTEDARRISDESVKSLQQTALFKLLQPERHRGLERHPNDFYRAVRAIASACGATRRGASVLRCDPWPLCLSAAPPAREG